MVKLTVELIARTDPFLNPLKDRELDLRGLKIPAIENLGATKDSIDALDLSDNAILSLSNLPRLTRLHTLLLANNPISTISPNIATQLPNLQTLVLSGSQFRNLGDLSPLFGLKQLSFLILSYTALSQQTNYRYWLIYSIPSLRWLDFQKVREKERQQAKALFEDAETGQPTELALSYSATSTSSITAEQAAAVAASGKKSKTFEVGAAPTDVDSRKAGARLTEEQKQRVRKAIENAGTIEEIQRLKRMLADGFIPDDRTVKALSGR